MTEVKVPHRAPEVGRLGTAAAWIAVVGCLPYLVVKLAWALDVPIGVADPSALEADSWAAGNALMALVQLSAVVLVLALVRPWGEMVPRWLLLLPVWVGTGMLFQVVVGAVLLALSSTASGGSRMVTGDIEPWVYVVVYASFAVEGIGLGIAFASHVRARWGRLLRERSSDVLARRGSSGPLRHLDGMLQVVAATAVAVALVCAYWALGGSTGLSDARLHDPVSLQASRAAGALVTAAGLLGLARRWGGRTPFWVPAALTWVGSGALVAFDGLLLLLNRLVDATGPALAAAQWAPIDTVLVVKAVIGVAAAVLGVLAFRAVSAGSAPGSGPAEGPDQVRAGRPHSSATGRHAAPR